MVKLVIGETVKIPAGSLEGLIRHAREYVEVVDKFDALAEIFGRDIKCPAIN